ncbi:helix-turn-helix domain-containing protein [Mesorhizobium sp. PL10]
MWKGLRVDRLEAILIAAVETGSVSAAGRKLGTPLVSRKVAELEAYLHTRLLAPCFPGHFPGAEKVRSAT